MTSIKNLVTTASTCLGKTFITCISYIHHHHWWLPGDMFHLLDSSNAIKNHEGERFPLHATVYDRGFALGNDVCHPVIELSEVSQCSSRMNTCHQVWLPHAPSMCVFSSTLVEKTISQRTDKLHQPNFRGTPSLATISYVRDLITHTHRWFSMEDYDDIICTKTW